VTAATAAQPNGSTTRTSFGGLNGIRAVGALLVLTTHVGFHSGAALNSTFNGLLSRMDVGVAIFFVISGFLLFRPHVVGWLLGTRRPGTRRYLKHRALRILPALWIAVVGAALLLPQESVPPSAFLRHATLTQIYSAGNAAQGLTQMWSLATEMAFYLLLPLLAWMVTRARPSTRSVLIALGILLITPLLGAAWMWVCAAGGGGLRALWLPGYLGWFGLGMALALWHTARSVGMLRRSWLDDAGSHPGSVWAWLARSTLLLPHRSQGLTHWRRQPQAKLRRRASCTPSSGPSSYSLPFLRWQGTRTQLRCDGWAAGWGSSSGTSPTASSATT